MLNGIVWNRTVYLFKMGLALNNLKRLIYHKTQRKKQTHMPGMCDQIGQKKDRKHQNNKVMHKNPSIKSTNFCQPCNS